MGLIEKYRPQKFCEFRGNDTLISNLKSMLMKKDRYHSYLISGGFGIGKTSLARLIAKALNCVNFDGNDICGECKGCHAIDNNYDIIEIDAATYRGINEIRRIKEFANIRPLEISNKVIIFDEAHQLTEEAISALLKIVEEPPSFTYFIFVTTEKNKIKPTLLSRLYIIELQFPTSKVIRDFVNYVCEQEGIPVPEDITFPSFRDFLKSLEGSGTGEVIKNYNLNRILQYFIDGNLEQFNQEVQFILDTGIHPRTFFVNFIDHFLDKLKLYPLKIDNNFIQILLDLYGKNEFFNDKATFIRIFNLLFWYYKLSGYDTNLTRTII